MFCDVRDELLNEEAGYDGDIVNHNVKQNTVSVIALLDSGSQVMHYQKFGTLIIKNEWNRLRNCYSPTRL